MADEGGFCFDFGDDNAGNDTAADAVDTAALPATLAWAHTEEEAMQLAVELDGEELNLQKESGLKILRVQPTLLEDDVCTYGKELKDRDIINGVYEGGFKLWSCAGDMVAFMKERNVELSGKRVCEAGCGHGIPAIAALTSSTPPPATVVFQDYNVEVLKVLTVPNVLVNCKYDPALLHSACQFWAGDWGAMARGDWDPATAPALTTPPQQFDVILTTDTLYTLKAVRALLQFIDAFLAPEGVVYVGSKTLYFGCGGGVNELQYELAERKPTAGGRRLEMTREKKLSDGLDNDREIVSLRWVAA